MSPLVELIVTISAIIIAELALLIWIVPRLRSRPPAWPSTPLKVEIVSEGRGYFHAGPGDVTIENLSVDHASFVGSPASIEPIKSEPAPVFIAGPFVGCIVHYMTDDEVLWPAIVLVVHSPGAETSKVDLHLLTTDGDGVIFNVPAGFGVCEWRFPEFLD
jgi:hypothetical protein